MRRPFKSAAATVSLLSMLACTAGQPASAQLNWSQVPGMIDVQGRITGTEKQIAEEQAAGRLTREKALALGQSLDKIKQLDTQYRQDGKLSIFERMRLVLDLDKLSQEIQSSLSERSAGITDVAGREAELSKQISDALLSGRLTSLEASALNQKLDAIKDKERVYRSDGVLNSTETLTLSLDLDHLASAIESTMKVRVIEDPGVDAKQAEIKAKIDQLQSAGKLTPAQAEPLRQELARIHTHEDALKASGGALTSEEVLTLALELERLKAQVDRYEPQVVPTAVRGIDARQDEIKTAIAGAQTAGKLTVTQAGELMQEFGRIEALESMYRADGSLDRNEIMTLVRDLSALKKRTDDAVAAAPGTQMTVTQRKESLRTRIEAARSSSLFNPASVGDELLAELNRIDSKETFYKLDGSLSDTENLIITQDLDGLSGRLDSALNKLPNLSGKKAEIETRINEALAASRLDPKKAEELKQELNRISFLESTFTANDGKVDDREAVALSKEFNNLESKMSTYIEALPDVDALQSEIDKKMAEAKNKGSLSDGNADALKKEYDRIASVEASFRGSDNKLSDWEVMALKRDLDKLAADLDRLSAAAPVQVTVDVGSVAPDTRGHWAEKYIAILSQRGTIGGFPDGSFKPDNGITRSQFAAIAMKALNLPPAGRDAKFSDLSSRHWAYKAISAVSDAGLVGGYPDGSFRPEDKITRAQALVILSKALESASGDVKVLDRYKDGTKVAAWAVPSVAKAANAGILVNHPDPYSIRPADDATRAEVAALTYQTMARLGQKLPDIKTGLEASTN